MDVYQLLRVNLRSNTFCRASRYLMSMENSVLGLMFSYVGSVAGQEFGREQRAAYHLRCVCLETQTPLYLTKFLGVIHYPTSLRLVCLQ